MSWRQRFLNISVFFHMIVRFSIKHFSINKGVPGNCAVDWMQLCDFVRTRLVKKKFLKVDGLAVFASNKKKKTSFQVETGYLCIVIIPPVLLFL